MTHILINKTTDFVGIPFEIIHATENGKPYFVASVLSPEELRGCIVQADSLQDAKDKLFITIQACLHFYEQESKLLQKRAIWLSNFSKREDGNFQFWFKILGIGLTINYRNKSYFPLKNKSNKEIKYIGITKQGGLYIGKFLIFFQNSWKLNKKL